MACRRPVLDSLYPDRTHPIESSSNEEKVARTSQDRTSQFNLPVNATSRLCEGWLQPLLMCQTLGNF